MGNTPSNGDEMNSGYRPDPRTFVLTGVALAAASTIPDIMVAAVK